MFVLLIWKLQNEKCANCLVKGLSQNQHLTKVKKIHQLNWKIIGIVQIDKRSKLSKVPNNVSNWRCSSLGHQIVNWDEKSLDYECH